MLILANFETENWADFTQIVQRLSDDAVERGSLGRAVRGTATDLRSPQEYRINPET